MTVYGRLWVTHGLPDVNALLSAQRLRRGWSGARRRTAYTETKKQATHQVAYCCRTQLAEGIRWPPCCYTVLVRSPTRRKDPDNLVGGALKMLLDGLQVAKVIPNDGFSQVLGVGGYMAHGPDRPGVFLVAAGKLLHRDIIEQMLCVFLEGRDRLP